jgi:O-antigen/teichoic acid export membrane protein
MLRRILSGVGAHFFNQFILTIIQLATVPILISFWGIERYGIWLILFTVPAYAALADLGFVTVAANDMTMSAAKGQKESAVRTFQSAWAMVTVITAALLLTSVAVLAVLPSGWLLGGNLIDETEIRLTIIALLLYTAATLHSTIIMGGFRCNSQYALGVLLNALVYLIEGLFLILAVVAGGHLAVAALALFAGRMIGVTYLALILRSKAPWLKFGFSNATIKEITRLFRPALAGMAIPLANAIYLQGMVIVLGTVVGPRAVSVFSTVRTLTRFGFQTAANVNLTLMPEFSDASARIDKSRQARLFALNIVACTTITVGIAMVILFGGTSIVRLWTGGQIVPSQRLVFLMCLVMVLNSAWFVTANLLLAINRHASYSVVYLAASIIAVLLGIPMSKAMGTEGAALALVALDVIMIIHVYHNAGRVRLVDWRLVFQEIQRALTGANRLLKNSLDDKSRS